MNTARESRRRLPVRTVAVFAVAGLLLTAFDWPQVRFGPEGTGFNPSESTIGASNVSKLQRRWFEESGAPAFESSPVVANGIVYATTLPLAAIGPSPSELGRLDAFDATTGTGKWSFQMDQSALTTSPAVANGIVYANSDDTLYAVDAASGTELWSATVYAADSSQPVVANGIVYISQMFENDGVLYAFNATTGALLWSTSGGFAHPVVANGVLYGLDSTTGPTFLDALNATTGALLWSASEGESNTGSSPAVANGVVYVALNKLDAFDATTGAPLWSTGTGSADYGSSSLAVANGVVYENGDDGYLHAVSATTGAPIWSKAMSSQSSPVVANGLIYDGVAGQIQAFSAATGTLLWSSPATGWAYMPIVANGVVYAGSDDYGAGVGHLEAFSLPVSGAGLTMSPTFAADYGTVLDGTSSSPTTFTVTNFGSSATTAVTDSLAGADPSQFRITSDTCARATLAGGASCTIGVAFAPTLPGSRTTTLAVQAAIGGSASANLSGTGNALTIDPAAKRYGTVLDGSSSPPVTFTVTNHSSTSISPTVASLAGSQFTASADTCGVTLTAHATCRVAVAFTPTGIGPISTRLSVSTAGVTTTATLSGKASPVAIVPPTKDYGTVTVGSSSPATFTVTNVTSAALPLPLGPSSINGTGFSITSDGCSARTLAVGARCTVVVAFTPSVTGSTYHGRLTVTYVSGCGIGGCEVVPIDHARLAGIGG